MTKDLLNEYVLEIHKEVKVLEKRIAHMEDALVKSIEKIVELAHIVEDLIEHIFPEVKGD